jgi:opacity protein-like surface antigen
MLKKLPTLLLLLAATLPAAAQDWSIGVHTGPFVFGDFVERTFRLGNEQGSERSRDILSAGTRAGAAFDIEHGFADRWAVRLEFTGTRAPLSVKGSDDDGFEIEAGDLDVGTLMLPIVFRINPRGSLRFHLMGGPAYAAYRIETGTSSFPVFEGTRTQWGAAFGGGAAWYFSDRIAVEGNLTDIVTSSPFKESDYPTGQSLDIPKTHNVHTTIGLRWRF